MKRFLSLASLLALTVLCVPTHAFGSDPALVQRIQTAMAEFKASATALGAPRLDGNSLFLGTSRMNGNYAIVDALKEKHGCTATVFARRGDSFVRISTNVIKEDGSRAVGTPLDPNGPAIAAIREDRAFYGQAEILGAKYETAYEPLRDETGKVIGILYVGYKLP